MASESGKTRRHIGDYIDEYFLDPVWLRSKDNIIVKLSDPFGSGVYDVGDDDGGGDGPNPNDPRPQLSDIKKPIKQVPYYENGKCYIKVTMTVYVSAEKPINKFIVASNKPVVQGGK